MKDSKHKLKMYFALGSFLVLMVGAVFYFFSNNNRTGFPDVNAQGKSKWQNILEKTGIDQTFWNNYLPNINHKEYKKALKSFQKSQNGSAGKLAPNSLNETSYPIHSNISTTIFWAGENASKDNFDITNESSCWDDSWAKHATKENTFYFALPYNDFDENGKRKEEASQIIPWAEEKSWGKSESMCKNRWIKITHGSKVAYAQWEDAGPCDDDGGCGENDKNYVFGNSLPNFSGNKNAGLDVSPAVKKALGLKDLDKTSWQFILEKDVPSGPWKKTTTTSGIYWK